MLVTSGIPKIRIFAGAREVIANGVVHIDGNEPVKVTIDNLSFVFCFLADDNDKEAHYAAEIKEGIFYLNLYNHNNTLGEGLLEPLSVATLNGKELSLTYYSTAVAVDAGKRRLEYAFYTGSKAE